MNRLYTYTFCVVKISEFLLKMYIFLVMRDTRERGRNLENVLFQYTNLVKPAFEEFCLPVSTLL